MTDIVDQPPPIPVEKTGRVAVWELVIADVQDLMTKANGAEEIGPHIEQVLLDMTERDEIGRKRYGTPLTAGNGRDHLVDAYQEALDLAVYLRTHFDEIGIDPREEEIEDIPTSTIRTIYINHLGNLVMLRVMMNTLTARKKETAADGS